MAMTTDRPVMTQWLETTAEGEQVVVAEVTMASNGSQACIILVDLSDSSSITAQDIRRLRKVLQVVPRGWRAIVRPFGMLGSGQSGIDSTVGEVVDGAADIERVLLGEESLRRGRVSGGFLGDALRRASIDDVSAHHTSTLVLVITDGRLHDVGAIHVSDRVRVLGIATSSSFDAKRWHDTVPNSEFLEPARPDTVAVVRRCAGCAFLGPCTIEVPRSRYRLRASLDVLREQTAPVEGFSSWDFTRGAVRIEIPASAAAAVGAITVRAEDGSQVTLPVSADKPLIRPAPMASETTAACQVVDMHREHANKLMEQMLQLVGQRTVWQKADGTVPLAVAEGRPETLMGPDGRPLCEALVVVVPECSGDDSDCRMPVAWVPVARDEVAEITRSLPEASFRAAQSGVLSFHRLDARWMLAIGGERAIALPPRGVHELSVAVTTPDGIQCRVFFSGSFRVG
jgi:hypothetical protein